jgi:hypothetical protein
LHRLAPPAIDDLAADAEIGRKKVLRIVTVLRDVENKVARRQNARGQLAEDLEVDEHAPRSFHISTKNPKFHSYVRKDLLKKKPPYFLNYWKVIGLRKRGGGRVYISFLPPNPVAPGAKPPTLGQKELLQSKLSGWFLVGFWLLSGWFLVGFWLVSGWFLVASGWFLVGFWLVYGWFLFGFWLVAGWFLVGF